MSTATDPRTLHRTCPLCEATCGLTLTMAGDRVTRVTGDRADVFSRGYICPKGAALGALHHDPDRLRAPRIREGTTWRTVDWPEAFAAVEAGLAPILAAGDRDALALYAGNPNVHGLAGMLYTPAVMRAAATRNVYSCLLYTSCHADRRDVRRARQRLRWSQRRGGRPRGHLRDG